MNVHPILGPLLPALLSAMFTGCEGFTPAPGVVEVTVLGLPTAEVEGGARLQGMVQSVPVPSDGERPEERMTVLAGGGEVSPVEGVLDRDGKLAFEWRLGTLPIANRVEVVVGEVDSYTFEATVDRPPLLEPRPFGDVDAFMRAEGLEGSTEDLAFDDDGKLVLGVPGALIAVSPAGEVTRLVTTGVPVEKPLGLACGEAGELWIADVDAEALLRMTPDLVVTRVMDRDGDEHFAGPNDVAVGSDGRIFLSDPCMGKVFAVDRGGLILGRSSFRETRGGPNGLAVSRDASSVWVTTGNTGLFCPTPGVELTDAVGGLYRIDVLAGGELSPPTTIVPNVATFGDGLAFDDAGNLYAIFDTVRDFALDESIVFVLRPGASSLVRVLGVKGRVFANLAWGRGEFGADTLYLALLLAVPFFTEPSMRGVERLPGGVRGGLAF